MAPEPAARTTYVAVQRGDSDIPLSGLQKPAPAPRAHKGKPMFYALTCTLMATFCALFLCGLHASLYLLAQLVRRRVAVNFFGSSFETSDNVAMHGFASPSNLCYFSSTTTSRTLRFWPVSNYYYFWARFALICTNMRHVTTNILTARLGLVAGYRVYIKKVISCESRILLTRPVFKVPAQPSAKRMMNAVDTGICYYKAKPVSQLITKYEQL